MAGVVCADVVDNGPPFSHAQGVGKCRHCEAAFTDRVVEFSVRAFLYLAISEIACSIKEFNAPAITGTVNPVA